MASRVTLTLALVVLALMLAHAFLSPPPSAYGIAMITAMQGALAVREAEAPAQLRTRLVCGLAGLSVAATAILLQPFPRLADALFVVLVFAAVYARKYGARWNAVGMFAFMCYFISAYLHPAVTDLPAIAVAIALSGAIAHLIRNRLLPEHPDEDFRRAVAGVGRRIEALEEAVVAGRHAGWTPAARQKAFRRQTRLGDAILSAEGYLPPESLSGTSTRGPMGDLAVSLFDLHLASESLIVADLAETSSPNERETVDERRRLAGERLRAARSLVEERARAAPRVAFTRASQKPPGLLPAPPGAWIEDPQLRLAIQVTIAAAIAMAGGLLLSKTRFFWAILTAFLVFTNTQSRGDTALRALNRAFGTMVGIVVGIGLAVWAGGNVPISIGLSAVFVFAGFYLLQVSYGAMTFFVTLTISLVYGLIGTFSVDLLVLRLEETLIGAVAGVFVAFAVLPQSTSSAARNAVEAILAALGDLLDGAGRAAETGDAGNLLALSRLLDHRYAALATAVRPFGGHWNLVRKPGPIRIALLRFMALAYWARRLAKALSAGPVEAGKQAALASALSAMRARLADLRTSDLLATAGQRPRDPSKRLADLGSAAGADDPLFALEVLTHVLDAIAGPPSAAGRAKSGQDPAAAISTEEAASAKGRRRMS